MPEGQRVVMSVSFLTSCKGSRDVGLPMKVREVVWLGFQRERDRPCGVLPMRRVGNRPQRGHCPWKATASPDIQRTPEAAGTELSCSGLWLRLAPLLWCLVWISSFLPLMCMAAQLPNASHFISFPKGFSGCQRPLGPAAWRADVPRKERPSGAGFDPEWWGWCVSAPVPCPSGEVTWGDVFLSRVHPVAHAMTCLMTHSLATTFRPLCPSPALWWYFLGLPPT